MSAPLPLLVSRGPAAPAPPDALTAILSACRTHAERPAVVEGARTTSYQTLEIMIRQAAYAMGAAARDLGVAGARPRALIAAPSGALAYAGMLGALMAGGLYAPVNLEAPDDKLARIIAQIRPTSVVCRPEDAPRLAALADAPQITAGAGPAWEGPPRPADRNDLAYVMFTSGSTGAPKGVMIARGALAHYVAWACEALALTPQDRVSQHPPLAFDISATDIYPALAAGAALFPLVSAVDRLAPARAIARHQLTSWNATPSVFSLIMHAGDATPGRLASLKRATFCGEPLTGEQARALFAACPDIVARNTYGPTEATVAVTAARLAPDALAAQTRASVTLGRALPGLSLFLDVMEGADTGELLIAGPQLAAGYWQDAEKTSAAFNTIATDQGPRRVYRTGDIVARHQGRLYFCARKDRQVKIAGHRVELEEVAAAARAAGWAGAAVVLVDGGLHAVIEAPALSPIEEAELAAAFAQRLEPYARPHAVHALARLPRNANDKLDLAAVATWVEDRLRAAQAARA